MESHDRERGLSYYLEWTKSVLQSPCSQFLLVFHNGRALDSRVILSELKRASLDDQFQDICAGFVDTLPLLRQVLPGKKSYALESLYQEQLQRGFSAHNAMADVQALCQLLCVT